MDNRFVIHVGSSSSWGDVLVDDDGGNENPLKDFGVRGEPTSILEEDDGTWRAEAGTRLGKRLLRAFQGAEAAAAASLPETNDEAEEEAGETGDEERDSSSCQYTLGIGCSANWIATIPGSMLMLIAPVLLCASMSATQSAALMRIWCAARSRGRGTAEGVKWRVRRGAPSAGREMSHVGERWALRVDMSATWRLSSAPGVQMSARGAVRRGIVARMAEFIEASIVIVVVVVVVEKLDCLER